ncbi:MAG: dihydroneopterin aldolase [Holosporales bacterium]|jgi:FolB domain-containing protein|nr:dihydroneopterin aldolase [Holosporales bacterium]
MNGELYLKRYRTRAILGFYPFERKQPREILVTVILRWTTLPRACKNDHLREAINYEDILRIVDESLQNRSFLLIERLACFLYDAVRSFVTTAEKGKNITLRVEAIKPYPPVAGLSESSFICSDW